MQRQHDTGSSIRCPSNAAKNKRVQQTKCTVVSVVKVDIAGLSACLPQHRKPLSPIPLVLGSVGIGLQAGNYISRTQKGRYIIVIPLERREGKHTRSSQENRWDHHVFQVSTETSPLVPVETPKYSYTNITTPSTRVSAASWVLWNFVQPFIIS